MNISLNPTVSGGFVYKVMRDIKVAPLIANMEQEDAHDLVKKILIAGFTHFKYDVNEHILRERNAINEDA